MRLTTITPRAVNVWICLWGNDVELDIEVIVHDLNSCNQ